MDHDIVLVTINYRLGAFGFFTLNNGDAPGNQGYWDQVLALEWVRDNIASYGGDPTEVTIFGESAGSWAVSYHLVSPASKGLFEKAIAQSGTMDYAPAFPSQTPEFGRRNAMAIAEAAGCAEGNDEQVLRCMQVKSFGEYFFTTH